MAHTKDILLTAGQIVHIGGTPVQLSADTLAKVDPLNEDQLKRELGIAPSAKDMVSPDRLAASFEKLQSTIENQSREIAELRKAQEAKTVVPPPNLPKADEDGDPAPPKPALIGGVGGKSKH